MSKLLNEHCPLCGKRFFFESDRRSHRCDPVFWVFLPEVTDAPEKSRGATIEEAVRSWAVQFDSDTAGEYLEEGEDVFIYALSDDDFNKLSERCEFECKDLVAVGAVKYSVSAYSVIEYEINPVTTPTQGP